MPAFDSFRAQAFPYKFRLVLAVPTIAGGTPTDQKVAEGWLRTKLTGADNDEVLREAVSKVMAERGVSNEEATKLVVENKHLNGFKRDSERGGELYVEGRQLKAAIKEAANVAAAADKIPSRKYGTTNKGLLGFVAEHIFVLEERLYLGVTEPSGVAQKFVHTWRGTGIQYEEYVSDAKVTATVVTDWEFDEKFWAMLWLTGEQQGLGASRSQGFGRYTVEEWELQR